MWPNWNVPAVRRRLAGEDPQQGRLAGAVQSEDEEAFAAPEVERHVGEDVRPAVPLGQPDRLDDRAPGGGRRREADPKRPIPLADVDAVVLDAGDPLLDAVGHRRLRRLGAEAVDDGLQPGDLLALPGGDLGGAALVLGAGADVLRIRAAVLDDRAGGRLARTVEMEDAGDRLVEQLEVVADHEQGAAVAAEEAEQPLLGIDVEVVGRLVEEQDVAAGEQDAGDLDAAPLATGEHADREILPRRVEPEPGGDRSGLALGGVPTVGAEQLLGPAVAGDGALVGMLLHGDAQLLDALDLVVDATAREHVGDRRAGVSGRIDPRILGQVAEPALADHPSRGRLGVAAEDAEQAGLAGAVAPDEADLVLGHDGEVGPLDDEAAANRHGETLRLQHMFKPRGVGGAVPTSSFATRFWAGLVAELALEVRCRRMSVGRIRGASRRSPAGSSGGGGGVRWRWRGRRRLVAGSSSLPEQ